MRAIRNGILFDVKADLRFLGSQGRFQQWTQLLINIPQRAIVDEQGFINLSQPLQDGGVGSQVFPQLYEGADDITLIATARELFRTLAAMRAPCSVKA